MMTGGVCVCTFVSYARGLTTDGVVGRAARPDVISEVLLDAVQNVSENGDYIIIIVYVKC